MLSRITVALAAVLLACASSVLAGCGNVLVSQSFNAYGGGEKSWTKDMAEGDFKGFVFLKSSKTAAVGNGVLVSKQPKGCYGTNGCGATFDVDFDPVTEATLTYKFKFEGGYDFKKGGKLPGLCDSECPAGCTKVGKNGGFSARTMWREGGDMKSYSYFYGMDSSSCGEYWDWGSIKVQPGKWNSVEMYVKLNDPGKANGEQRIKFNGKSWYKKGIAWRTDDRGISTLTFRNFHGGNSQEWASPKDQDVYFDDIRVVGGNCGGSAGGGGGSSPSATAETDGSARAGSGVLGRSTFTEEEDSDFKASPKKSSKKKKYYRKKSKKGGKKRKGKKGRKGKKKGRKGKGKRGRGGRRRKSKNRKRAKKSRRG